MEDGMNETPRPGSILPVPKLLDIEDQLAACFAEAPEGLQPPQLDGWLLCDGREVPVSEYPELYDALGDRFGVPSKDGYFRIPNLQGRLHGWPEAWFFVKT